MGDPHVSFVVPSYNYARYLPDCLNSILNLEGGYEIEVIVIDDASTDDTQAVLATFTDARIRKLRNEVNRGHAATVETGLRATRGALVARIDPDDRYRSDFLTRTVPVFERHAGVGAVYGDAAMIDEQGRLTAACTDTQHGGREFLGNEYVALLARNFICAPTLIARRECWLDALPVPPNLAFNDWYFTLTMARRWQLCFLPVVLADYRVHAAAHHVKVAREGTEERSIRWLLDRLYAETEQDPALDAAKRRAKRFVYGSHQLDAAEKYFGFGAFADARRCYLNAFALRPALMLRASVLRHLLGTLMGKRLYEGVKRAAGAGAASLLA